MVGMIARVGRRACEMDVTYSPRFPVQLRKFIVRRFSTDQIREVNEKKERGVNLLFIHVPKTGGVSISNAIIGQEVGHTKYRVYESLDPDWVNKVFSFSFVRNPFWRVHSAFRFIKWGSPYVHDQRWARKYLKNTNSFTEFCQNLQNDAFWNRIRKYPHFALQKDFLENCGGRLGIDYIGRFESIESDFNEICKKLEFDAPLPHLNKHHAAGSRSLDKINANIIANRYAPDFDAFGYDVMDF